MYFFPKKLTELPDSYFWLGMKHLQVLFLHSNPLSDIETFKFLGSCPALEILTLYDTPLSLKENYRHHAVNSIFTLKALDKYVVSDEEIIEEAEFKNRFSTLNKNLKINLTIPPTKDNCLSSEIKATNDLIRRVNRIMAFNSPVLIIQKNIRRYLVMKKQRMKKLQLRM